VQLSSDMLNFWIITKYKVDSFKLNYGKGSKVNHRGLVWLMSHPELLELDFFFCQTKRDNQC